jgi:hypothetical protein
MEGKRVQLVWQNLKGVVEGPKKIKLIVLNMKSLGDEMVDA